MWLWEVYKIHINFGIINGKIMISAMSHEDFKKVTLEEIRNYRKKVKGEKLIKFALEKAVTGFRFIIFWDKEDEGKFIQFWVGNKQLIMDFPMNSLNGLNKYYKDFLELIMEYGFVHTTDCEVRDEENRLRYSVRKEGDWTALKANFGQDTALAAKFVSEGFEKILGIKLKRVAMGVE